MRHRVLLPILLAAALVPSAVALPAGAAPAAVTAVTLVSETSSGVGGMRDLLYAPGAEQVRLTGDPSEVLVQVGPDGYGPAFTLAVAAPPGERLQPGSYLGAQRSAFREPGRPGLDVSGNGSGCNAVDGRFTVLDIASTGDTVERLHVLYEQRCDGFEPALFGEIRYRVPGGDSDLLVAPAQVAWPLARADVRARPVPVTLRNTAAEPVDLGTPVIEGASASSFRVVDDACPSRLPVGRSCKVYVGFEPAGAGPHTATLRVADSTQAGSRTVVLAGEAAAETSSWSMRSEPGDVVGGGRAYDWTPTGSVMSASGTIRNVRVNVDGPDGRFTAGFTAGKEELLQAGRTYEGVGRYEDSFPAPGLGISRPGHRCERVTGRFTVHELVAGNTSLDRLAVTFEQRCDDSPATLTGSIAYRAQQPVPPPPGEPRPRFSDIAGDAHEDSIVAAARNGVATGFSDGSYRPGSGVDRAQAAALLRRALDLPRTSSAGSPRSEPVDGAGGSTSWRMRTGRDSEGESRSYAWTPDNATIHASGDEASIRVDVDAGPDYVTAFFRPGRNEVLLPGRTYERARRNDTDPPSPGIDVVGTDSGCNTSTGRFTVHELAFGSAGLEHLSLTFEQQCDGDPEPLRGSVTYRSEQPARSLPGDPDPHAPFSDITGSVHALSIEAVAAEGVAGGFSDGTFRPRLSVTRGQLASFLSRALALPPAPPAGFRDTAGTTHEAAIDAAAAAGLVGGYGDGSFRPDAVVTRGQLATFLVRAARSG